ncbi:DUF4834 family protein [Marinoscillum furvescens]|uniref:Uncharacterized protein DUF4834 n=1 Tax=Marinoscillum furvescens DSM 4134 TaxID=1122208 RepID=A0A3D9LKQ0_MARFU|nr:DUF4834 family protein [Marinoscillum furvescens]REE05832.1 uncharacterized protein DUF4834 [Marinoscillum furvescens DSM 4134]
MLKFLIIIGLIAYVFFKVGGALFRMFFLGASQQQRTQYQNQRYREQAHQSRKAPGSNVNIDYVPRKEEKSDKDFQGGDYVDYEEVK